jgi:hypothetical protein
MICRAGHDSVEGLVLWLTPPFRSVWRRFRPVWLRFRHPETSWGKAVRVGCQMLIQMPMWSLVGLMVLTPLVVHGIGEWVMRVPLNNPNDHFNAYLAFAQAYAGESFRRNPAAGKTRMHQQLPATPS